MQEEEYIIINKTAIRQRIEELEKELLYHNEWYEKARESYHLERKNWGKADDGEMRVASDAASTTAQEIKILKQILSQSIPLIPEIEKAYTKAFSEGIVFGLHTEYKYKTSEDYISNLKLDI